MFDISKRKDLTGATVDELIGLLQQLPTNATLCCCGDNNIFLHVEKDGSAVSFDTEDLDECYADDPDTSPEVYWAERDGIE